MENAADWLEDNGYFTSKGCSNLMTGKHGFSFSLLDITNIIIFIIFKCVVYSNDHTTGYKIKMEI